MDDQRRLDALRRLLCRLQDDILEAVLAARSAISSEELAAVAAETQADTIYAIDKISEGRITLWFQKNWPADQPVEVVMEGLEGPEVVFPAGTAIPDTVWKCIIDPIDGTRGLMYDKRSAWSLAALAPQRGPETNLSDIQIAAMTELPTSKQWRADQVSAVRGCGPSGVIAEAIDVRGGRRSPLALRPSRAREFLHGFASLARFFPQGKGLLATLEEDFWAELHGREPQASPLVFDDQYISSSGQIYELAAGHDRMLGDLRPLVFRKLGLGTSLTCHPYDIATALILEELGGVVETPAGKPLSAPLDTTSPVAWLGFANEDLADLARPILRRLIAERLGGVD